MTPPFAQGRIEKLLEHSTWIRALALQLVRDPGTADDLVQKTWLAALERPPSSPGDSHSLRRWLAACLRNFARQERRGEGRRAAHESLGALAEAQPSTFDVVARASLQREVVEAVLSLDEPYRTTILLRFFDNLPPRVIAKRMNVPVDTVRTRVARGIARLRQRLDERHGGDRATWLAALVPLLAVPTTFSGTTSGALGATLVNAKIQIAAAVLVVGGALTLYFATRGEVETAVATPPSDSPTPLAETPPTPSSHETARASLSTEPAADARAPAPMATTQAPIAEIAAGPAILEGRVLDDRGRPVSGVQVVAEGEDGKRTGDAVTSGTDGSFEMPFPKDRARLLSADERFETVLAGIYSGTSSGMSPGRQPSGESIVVVAPRVRVSGRVVGEEGHPLPGARVEIEIAEDLRTRFSAVLDRSAILSWAAASDEQGAFSIAGAPRVEGAKLRVSKDGYATFSGSLDENSGDGLVITLARPHSEDGMLRGKVVDAAGSPVAGARVAFGIDGTRSESDGSFSFKLVDPESFGAQFEIPAMELVAVKKGHLPARYEPPIAAGEPRWPANVVLRLGETPLAIEGHVVDADGDGFAGASVWIADTTLLGAGERGMMQVESVLAGADDVGWRRIDADGEGRFRIDGLLPREYRIRAMDKETLLIAEDGPFAAGSVDVLIRLPTDELYPKVAGRVVSHAGKPVAGARIFPMCDAFRAKLKGQTIGTSHEALDGTTTDAEGRFELPNVPKSLVYVRVEGDDILPLEYGRYVEGDERFTNTTVRGLPKDKIEDLQIVVDMRCHVQVELADPTTADALSVLDADGNPLIINVFVGNGRREEERVEIVDGRSYPMAVSDTGRTIVLFKQGLEVSRTSVELTPGELKQVRL